MVSCILIQTPVGEWEHSEMLFLTQPLVGSVESSWVVYPAWGARPPRSSEMSPEGQSSLTGLVPYLIRPKYGLVFSLLINPSFIYMIAVLSFFHLLSDAIQHLLLP